MKAYSIQNNQVVVEDNGVKSFFSYGTLIAKIENNKVILDSYYWDYSKTTLKWLKVFLNRDYMSKKDIQKCIENEQFTIQDLQGE